MTEERDYRAVFDVRQVNILKMDKAIDLEIMVAECDKAIADINRQIGEGIGDKRWYADAMRAKTDIEHKKALTVRKLDAIKANKAAVHVPTPESNFKARFLKAAQEHLSPDLYERIREMAAFNSETNPVTA